MSEKRNVFGIVVITALILIIAGLSLPSFAALKPKMAPVVSVSAGQGNGSEPASNMNQSMNATGPSERLQGLNHNFNRLKEHERERLKAIYQKLNNNERNIIDNMPFTVQRRYLKMSQNKLRQRLQKLRVIGKKELSQIRKINRTKSEIRNLHHKINKFESEISKNERELSQQRQNLKKVLNHGNLSDQITSVKKYLNTTVNLLENWIKSKQANINSLETVNAQFINKSQQMLSDQLLELSNISHQIQNATTKDQLKSINKELSRMWNHHYSMNEMLSVMVNARSTGEYILRANIMKTKLENALSLAESEGKNTSIVNSTVSQFNNAINLSETYYLQAKQILNTTSFMNVTEKVAAYKNVRKLLQKSRSSMADANKDLVKVVRSLNQKRISLKFENTGAYIMNRNIVSDLNKSPELENASFGIGNDNNAPENGTENESSGFSDNTTATMNASTGTSSDLAQNLTNVSDD